MSEKIMLCSKILNARSLPKQKDKDVFHIKDYSLALFKRCHNCTIAKILYRKDCKYATIKLTSS